MVGTSTGPSDQALCSFPRLLTLRLSLAGLQVLQLGQKKVSTALQVWAWHVELHISHQLLEAGKVRRLTEIL